MIAIIGTVGVPACYGGFETLVENLLESDKSYTVYCSSRSYKQKRSEYKGATLVYFPLHANGVASVLYDAVCMLHALLKGGRVLLVLGVSAGLLLPLIRIFTRRKLVTNIDGLEWRRDKWSWLAKKFLKLSERAAVRFSHVVIADNQGIADYVKKEYGVESTVIAYGGDHVLIKERSNVAADYAFGVCRIEPENNIHIILEAFSKSNKKLKFVGNWASSDYGRELKSRFSRFSNIEIIDPIYDLDVLFDLRAGCRFYVHGHSAGGTNPSLVEAMFFSKPIVSFDCIYNRSTLEDKGYYFKDVYSLESVLSSLDVASFKSEGDLMLEIANRRYSWAQVRREYEAIFDCLD